MAPTKAEKLEKDQVLQALSTRLFCDILDDFIMDVTLETHAEVSRSRALCQTCGTRCNSAHVPASSGQNSQAKASPSRAETSSGTEGGSRTPNGTKGDGTINLECVNCQRIIASNRYAPHLSNCMGLNTSRRGAARATTKVKRSSDAGRSGSPASEAGYPSDDNKSPSKGKGAKQESELNLKRKRPISPQVSPSKKQKQKGSPVSRVKSEIDGIPGRIRSLPSANSQSKLPSKLRQSSTAPLQESNSSRESSPDASLSSALSSSLKNKGLAKRPTPAPLKQLSPPRPPPSLYIEQDDGGEETGSSTDTSDSS